MEEFKLTFENFIVSLAQTAYVQLGIVEDPFNKEKNKDLKQAKGTIDLIELIKEKTRGNLTENEQKLIEEVLYDLRMKYLYETDKQDK